MTRKLTLKEGDGAEFFDIIQLSGKKYVHILCYYFKRDSDETNEKGEELSWARVDGTGIIISIDEFVKNIAEKGVNEYVDEELWQDTTQYQWDITATEAASQISGTYNVLAYDEIIPDTPYGEYVTLTKNLKL